VGLKREKSSNIFRNADFIFDNYYWRILLFRKQPLYTPGMVKQGKIKDAFKNRYFSGAGFVEIEKAGHFPFYSHPGVFTKIVGNFLTKVSR